jgi:SAM-dependent methyltransferase
MANQDPKLIEKIRQQFEHLPYPNVPLDKSPKHDLNFLFVHNLVTPYYLRNQKVIETEDKVILDAGCGSGYKALALAEANPGAKVVGVDLSEASVNLARQRLQYYGFGNTEFYAISIEDLPSLNLQFDYINNDEVLYLLPDPVAGLQAMKSVLKSDGIIRTNLHSALQRSDFFRAQAVFRMMGLMDENPQELELGLVREIMEALKDEIYLKVKTWHPEKVQDDSYLLTNYLLQGDKGFTIPEVFAALKASGLEFISMVQWQRWEITNLFKAPDNLPAFLEMSLPEIVIEERLHLFELLHPMHRLLDFWCGHPSQDRSFKPVSEWQLSDWQQAQVHLHPQLKHMEAKEELITCINRHRPFDISRYVNTAVGVDVPFLIDSTVAASLLPLWNAPQSVTSIVERLLQVRAINPVTLEPTSKTEAFEEIKRLLSRLEVFLYVLLETSS